MWGDTMLPNVTTVMVACLAAASVAGRRSQGAGRRAQVAANRSFFLYKHAFYLVSGIMLPRLPTSPSGRAAVETLGEAMIQARMTVYLVYR
ncbi:hypothetical protein F5Y17DRAFT_134801 [Xylariaceae sp. FL0594]|nr:hypothetical protein F5Y17DRAFT_134801 [Xylariaceae sp. FL0594]